MLKTKKPILPVSDITGLTGHYEKVFKLNNSAIDEVSGLVWRFLKSINTGRDTAIRVRLTVEESLLRWLDHFGENTEFRLEMGTHWNRPFIIIKLWSHEFDPLSNAEDDLGEWAEGLLSAIGLMPTYRYVNGCNILQIPLRRPHTNPGITLLICTLVGALIGVAIELFFPADIKTLLTNTVLTPLQNAFIRVLNAVSAPVMFLSVLTTTCGVGSLSLTGRAGKHMIRRFILYSTLVTIAAVFLSLLVFDVPEGASALSQREVSGVLDFFLDVFPGDVLSPFIQGDFTQLIVVALVIGNALAIAGAKVQTLISIVDEANTVGLVIAEWIGDLSPGFVTILVILGIRQSTIHMLLGIWRPAILIVLIAVFALLFKMVRISLYYRVTLLSLCRKMKESFLLSLKTFSVDASYLANIKCCEKRLGISHQMTSYALPIGLICFMPCSTVASTVFTLYAAECYEVKVSVIWLIMAIFLSVTLAAAGPPTAGIGILTYTVMFSRLHIPAQALTIVLVGDILMGFVIYPVNQALLQLDLISQADRYKMLNRKILQK